jgi:hypothetical protein
VLARVTWGGLLGLCLAACGSGTPSHYVDTKGYSLSCASVADCFAVYAGPVGCCGGGCPNVAIRAVDLPKYTNAFDQASKCSVQPPCAAQNPALCLGRLSCNAGVCTFELPDAGSASD